MSFNISLNPVSAIGLQECWLSDADNVSMFNLENYEMLFLPKSCCAHGGLIIYVHNQFQCTVMSKVNPIRSGGGGFKSPLPPIFCPHAFNF